MADCTTTADLFPACKSRKIDIDFRGGDITSEPTLQRDLPEFAAVIHDMRLSVKLDTNGSRPHVIRQLIFDGLLDYIAMDIKAPLHMYDRLSSKRIRASAIHTHVRDSSHRIRLPSEAASSPA